MAGHTGDLRLSGYWAPPVVSEVDRAAVLKVLDPIWKAKNRTARKVRGRIEAVLDAAAVRGQRGEENPARILSLRPVLGSKRPKVVHHASLPYKQLPACHEGAAEAPGDRRADLGVQRS